MGGARKFRKTKNSTERNTPIFPCTYSAKIYATNYFFGLGVIKIKKRRFCKNTKLVFVQSWGGGAEGKYRKLAGVHFCVGQIIGVYRHTSVLSVLAGDVIQNLP